MITCENCGKVRGQGDGGNHWICQDCKAGPLDLEPGDERRKSGE